MKYRNVCLLFDEMKIQEGLMFRKDGTLVGFVNIGDINSSIKRFEATIHGSREEVVADHMLTIMVRGIFIKATFPLASFPTKGIVLIN